MTDPILATEAPITPDGQTETTSADSLLAERTEQKQETPVETAEVVEEPKAPETYEFVSPEGIEVDAEIHKAYAEAARDLDLTQDQAQALHDKTLTVFYKRAMDVQEAQTKEWIAAAESDSEYGGKMLDENRGIAKKALDVFGSDGLRELLSQPNGIGNHPEMIRLMVRVGKAVSEDRFVGGGDSTGPEPGSDAAMAAALYG